MDEFKLDENNILLKVQYEKGDNYFIRNNSIGDKCYIFVLVTEFIIRIRNRNMKRQ